MTEYQYTNVPKKLEQLLVKIRETGVPDRITQKWLKQAGFSSSNDRSLIRVLIFIGFTDGTGKPTEVWTEYRGENHRHVLANCIRQEYSELFDLYRDAPERNNEDLVNFFRSRSVAGKRVIDLTVRTFTSLCDLADFDSVSQTAANTQIDSNLKSRVKAPERPQEQITSANYHNMPDLHIDVQIHISSDASAEQIDSIFLSMAKHIYHNR